MRNSLLLALVPALLSAQSPDSTKRDSTRKLEAVTVSALRAGGATPTSATTLDKEAIERDYSGQDAPLALNRVTGVTATSDAGPMSGYSKIRLRGIDQRRLAISLDGVPLNDPEDQVLYFSNVPDFMNSIQSVRVQRGVGSSAFGTASFAGSLDFESVSLLSTPRFAETQITSGSWGTKRVSFEASTGPGTFAAYVSGSGKDTEGYRHHSGNRSQSTFFSAGWFGDRNALKLTGFAGGSEMQPSYNFVSESDLNTDRRANTNSTAEQDKFHQEMVSLQYTRVVNSGLTITTTGYRNSAAGWFGEVPYWKIYLDHAWYGAFTTLTWNRKDFSAAAGAHVSTYGREHYGFFDPDMVNRAYDNTGHKSEQSAFAKATWTLGAVDVSSDVQVRRAGFEYEPTAGNSFGTPKADWTFVNPKVGMTWRAAKNTEVFASVGYTGREPTRNDMFAGDEDINDSSAPDYLPLTRIKPERLTDGEVGARWKRGTLALSANAFGMWFGNEIAPIGVTTTFGKQLRTNVGRTTRLGVELDAAWQANAKLEFTGNLMAMHARIAEYTDQTTSTTYKDVPPLLSPPLVANFAATWKPTRNAEFGLSAKSVAKSHLANDGNDAFMTPSWTLLDASAKLTRGRVSLRTQLLNLLDDIAYTEGEVSGGVKYFIPAAGRTALLTFVLGL